MKSREEKSGSLLPCVKLLWAVLGFAALTTGCMSASEPVEKAASQMLVGTHWRLTQLGDVIVDNPAGERDVHFVLQGTDLLVSGNAGCNRMFGRYALKGDAIKFDQMGGTRMFCEARMELEQKFLGMFGEVSGWRITGNTLQLLDGAGKAVGTFEAE